MTHILLDSVLAPNPTLFTDHEVGTGRRSKSSTRKVDHYVKIKPSNVEIWEDFNFSTIISGYGHVIHTILKEPPRFRPTRSMCELGGETSMRNIVLTWCKDRVNEGMKSAAASIQRELRQSQIEPSLRVEEIGIKRNPELDRNVPRMRGDRAGTFFKPDTYVIGLVERNKGPIYMPIEIKPSTIWQSSMLLDETVDPNTALHPLRQLGTYCKSCDVRIGLIITSNEAVAVRYYNIDVWEVGCQYMPVPWSNSGRQLTVNFTLWACVMLSLNDKYHHIVPRSHLFPDISTWQAEPGLWRTTYRHIYSGHCTNRSPRDARVLKKAVRKGQPPNEIPERIMVNIGASDGDLRKEQNKIKARKNVEAVEKRTLHTVKSGRVTK